MILAAGFSSRLGMPKALVRVHGVSLLRRTVALAVSLRAARVIVVVPPGAELYRAQTRHRNVTLVRNPGRAQGLSSSVRCGLKRAWYCAGVLLLPVDLAHLKHGELKRLVSRWRSAPGRIHATRLGLRGGGTPLILPKRLFPNALRIAGDVGLRELLNELPAAQKELLELPSARFDVDTVLDLAAARCRWT